MRFAESDTVELKAEIVGDICKEIVAFANTHGGMLYVGVRDDGEVVGVGNADGEIQRLSSMVRDSIKPDLTMFVRYDTETVEGKTILAVTVQKGTDRPYYIAAKG